MAAIKDKSFFARGKVLYVVYGHTVEGREPASCVSKCICLGKATHYSNTLSRLTDSLYVNVLKSDGKSDWTSSYSLMDFGVMPKGRSPYNLNRVFNSMADALDFVVQCQTGLLDNADDQRQAERFASPEYKEEQRLFDEMMVDLLNDYE